MRLDQPQPRPDIAEACHPDLPVRFDGFDGTEDPELRALLQDKITPEQCKMLRNLGLAEEPYAKFLENQLGVQ